MKTKIIISICILLLTACTTYQDGFNKEAWNRFQICAGDSRYVWDSDKQQCFEAKSPEGCIELKQFEQIYSRTMPINIPITDDLRTYAGINVNAYCLDWSIPNGNDLSCTIGRYKIMALEENTTLCWEEI